MRFKRDHICIRHARREIRLAHRDFYLVPIMLEVFAQTFDELSAPRQGAYAVLDFSRPGTHRYIRHDLTLSFPGMAEDDSIAGYTHRYRPQPGDLVFDIGAHAGFTTCILARMVAPGGRVIAFEPDPVSLEYLARNLRDQNISNVTVVPKAVDAFTGTASFNADGTMGAGLADHSVYGNTGKHIVVETTSLADACATFGTPQFLKMDIEGAEIAVIASVGEFLRTHPMHLAFDSYHRMRDGRYTYMLLEPMLSALGYDVESSAEFGQMFTWASPRS